MGGYDVFVSKKQQDNSWSTPENLGYPINTTDDDLFYYPYKDGKEAYVSRLENDGYGGLDVYKVIYNEQLVEEELTSTETLPVEKKDSVIPDTSQTVAAEETSASAMSPDTTPKVAEKEKTGTIKAKTLPGVVKTIEIAPVLFEFDRAVITVLGKQDLDKVVQIMKDNPNVNVQLVGYADALGPEHYNMKLSENRAVAALRYLVSNGIDASRLQATGKGETDFIAPNTRPDGSDYPAARKFNRRVEFIIQGIDEKNLMIKRINPVPESMSIQMK